ncbi:MAG TPA: class I SAM-dependent methyltransferase, partial [Edaphobacter sp.]|nr:class I SAM-dependent methyltransferase [Edaphobacter sp.]
LQVGSGATRLHPSIINTDLVFNPQLDCCARAESLPFADESVLIIVSQETLEHVQGISSAISEMYRVLRKDGTLYCQVPFIIGYHPGPHDFWRFTREGIREMFEQAGFIHEETGIAVGPCVGFYRIAVEFGAVLASRVMPQLYRPFKGLMALLLYPIKLLDPVMLGAPQVDRIPGGYYVIMRKSRTAQVCRSEIAIAERAVN